MKKATATYAAQSALQRKNDYDGMIAIDSANVHRILRGAVGCKRFRIIFEGPGGHSLHKFGIVGSAIHGLSRAIVRVDELKVPTDPKCTFNFGVIKGGTSVNAIAHALKPNLISEASISLHSKLSLRPFLKLSKPPATRKTCAGASKATAWSL